MNRREAIKNVTLLLGGTVISTSAFLGGCQSNDNQKKKGSITSTDIELLDEIAETIIPTTDTPGAKAAGVGSFMAMMVPDCYSEKNQASFRKGLKKIQKEFKDTFGHSFLEGKKKERQKFLTGLDAEIQSYNQTKKKNTAEHYFRIMKELTLLGYFTSEIGCTQARRYVQTPGRFDACIPYERDERAWTIRIPGSS